MFYPVLAALIALIHGGFVVFVVFGGLLLYWLPWIPWLHIPCALYGVMIMLFNWRCPLTELEIWLRQRGGEKVEWSEFLYRYLWSHVGLVGNEWFVTAGFVVTLFICNWQPYNNLL